jgi:hypothetical protein
MSTPIPTGTEIGIGIGIEQVDGEYWELKLERRRGTHPKPTLV